MSSHNLIPEGDDWRQNVHYGVFNSKFIVPNYCYNEVGVGWFGTLTPGEFAVPNELALAQETGGGGYCYPEHPDFVWDCAAQSSQYDQLAQPLAQPPTKVYLGNLATTDHGLQPETPASSETSPRHYVDSVQQRDKEKNREAAARCRKKGKKEHEDLSIKEGQLGIENKRLKAEKRKLMEEKLSLIYEILRHNGCGEPNIQRFIQSRAGDIARIAAKTNAGRLD
ncbi:hypothetical protein PGQ11_007717 [Apiospora arundinis]|uniref:BZIP domain-containing protein n=1 Tax=Apiospora arundinis TaxID=335852 RepID=A0ABR2IX08_9PEZI